jgi:hypothetical protein
MSKRYSQDLVPFLNKGIVVTLHNFKEEVVGIMGLTNPPSMFDRFLCGKTLMKKTHFSMVT